MIRAKNVKKSFGKSAALKGISLSVPKGSLAALIGPNGSGKSTLLRVIARQTKADCGTVEIAGRESSRYGRKEFSQTLAFLAQSNPVHSRITVRELVEFGRFPYNRGRLSEDDRRKVASSLEALELDALAGKLIGEISGGQMQRALIAMALAQDTPLFVLDEPASGLDIRHAGHLMNVLRKSCKERGKTVLLSLHEVNWAASCADLVFALKDGSLEFAGSPADVMTAKNLSELYGATFTVIDVGGKPLSVYC